jgi:hypothetical protein
MTAHHIATLLTPAWGQTTSYIHVATQMLNKDPDVVITIVQHNVMGVYVVCEFTKGLFLGAIFFSVQQMETELASEGRTYNKARLRIVGVGPKKFVLFCFIWVGYKRGSTSSLPVGWRLSANSPSKAVKDGPRHTRFMYAFAFRQRSNSSHLLDYRSWIGASEDL